MNATFKLCTPSLRRYRGLRMKRSAKRMFLILPFPTVQWSDEHPKGEFGMPTCHPDCRRSFEQLLLARHEVWKGGRPDRRRERLWRQARKALPDWPGFARCVMSTALRRAIRSAESQHLDFFKTLSEWADSVEISPTKFTATKKL